MTGGIAAGVGIGIVVLVVIAVIVVLILRRNVLKSEPDADPEFVGSAATPKSMADQIAAGVSLTHWVHSIVYGRVVQVVVEPGDRADKLFLLIGIIFMWSFNLKGIYTCCN